MMLNTAFPNDYESNCISFHTLKYERIYKREVLVRVNKEDGNTLIRCFRTGLNVELLCLLR